MSIDFYPTGTYSGEIDLREEIKEIFFGSSSFIAKGQILILRRMQRNSGITIPTTKNDLVKCHCMTKPSNEPVLHTRCNDCQGEGFLFTDEFVTTYKVPVSWFEPPETVMKPTVLTIPRDYYFFQYNVFPSNFDKIIELIIDSEGKPANPIKIWKRHDIEYSYPFRSDNGRIEFWRCQVKID